MKRNMDLVREILLQIEATEPEKANKLDISSYGKDEIGPHVELMIEHGLIKGNVFPSNTGPAHRILGYHIERMTWEGHDFLEAARNDTIWKKAKEKCIEATGGLTLDGLKACLVELGKQAIGQP